MSDTLDIQTRLTDEVAEKRRQAVLDISALSPQDAQPLILIALGDEDWRVRKEAVSAAVRNIDYSKMVTSLIEAVRDEDNIGLKNAAIEALSAAGEKVLSEVIGSFQSKDPEARKAAVDIVGMIQSPLAVNILAEALLDENLNVRVSAAERLGLHNSQAAQEALIHCLGESLSLLRLTALESLRTLKVTISRHYLEPLLNDPILLEEVLLALGRTGDKEVVPDIMSNLSTDPAACLALEDLHDRSEATAKAVESALETADLAVSDALLKMTQDNDPSVMKAAVRCILWSKKEEHISEIVSMARNSPLYPLLIDGLNAWGAPAVLALCALIDKESDHRLASVIGLLARIMDDTTGREVAQDLVLKLSSSHPAVTTAAAHAVGRFGDERVAAKLAPLLSQDDPRVRGAAGLALLEIGRRYPSSIRSLLQHLPIEGAAGVQICRVLEIVGTMDDFGRLDRAAEASDPELKRAALRALAAVGGQPALFRVVSSLSDTDLRIQIAAADALAVIGPSAGDAVVQAIGSCNGPVLAALIRTLGKVGHKDAESILSDMCNKSADIVLSAVEAAVVLGIPLTSMRVGLLNHEDKDVVKAALAAFGKDTALKVLFALLSHESWDVRLATVTILAPRTTSFEVRERLLHRLTEEDDDLVIAAIRDAVSKKQGDET
jgi:HEAT repeat protein